MNNVGSVLPSSSASSQTSAASAAPASAPSSKEKKAFKVTFDQYVFDPRKKNPTILKLSPSGFDPRKTHADKRTQGVADLRSPSGFEPRKTHAEKRTQGVADLRYPESKRVLITSESVHGSGIELSIPASNDTPMGDDRASLIPLPKMSSSSDAPATITHDLPQTLSAPDSSASSDSSQQQQVQVDAHSPLQETIVNLPSDLTATQDILASEPKILEESKNDRAVCIRHHNDILKTLCYETNPTDKFKLRMILEKLYVMHNPDSCDTINLQCTNYAHILELLPQVSGDPTAYVRTSLMQIHVYSRLLQLDLKRLNKYIELVDNASKYMAVALVRSVRDYFEKLLEVSGAATKPWANVKSQLTELEDRLKVRAEQGITIDDLRDRFELIESALSACFED